MVSFSQSGNGDSPGPEVHIRFRDSVIRLYFLENIFFWINGIKFSGACAAFTLLIGVENFLIFEKIEVNHPRLHD